MGENTYIPGKIANGSTIEKFRFTTSTSETDPDVALCGTGETMNGVAQNDPGDNEQVSIVATGPSFLVVNGNSVNIVIGDPLKSDGNGLGVKAASNNDVYGAVAREAATADGATIKVDVIRPATLSV